MQRPDALNNPPSGFLLIQKPAGMTSHDVVDAVRRALGIQRVGHAGTLDPLATGLLIVGVGKATKELGRVTAFSKTYRAEILLGATSTTDDAGGEIQERSSGHEAEEPTKENVTNVLQGFVGTIAQTPPAYSAVKIRGVPAHRRVRRGEKVTLKARPVTIHALRLLDYAYPLLRIEATVSSGTYIRALARDIGNTLGTGAYLSGLIRTAIGPYSLTNAVLLKDLSNTPLRSALDGSSEKLLGSS